MKQALRDLLVCPISKQHLLPVADTRLQSLLQQAAAQGQLFYADGEVVQSTQFLVTQNKTTVYSVVDGMPWLMESKQVLVPDEAEGHEA